MAIALTDGWCRHIHITRHFLMHFSHKQLVHTHCMAQDASSFCPSLVSLRRLPLLFHTTCTLPSTSSPMSTASRELTTALSYKEEFAPWRYTIFPQIQRVQCLRCLDKYQRERIQFVPLEHHCDFVVTDSSCPKTVLEFVRIHEPAEFGRLRVSVQIGNHQPIGVVQTKRVSEPTGSQQLRWSAKGFGMAVARLMAVKND